MSIARCIIGLLRAQKQYEQRSEIRHVRQTVIRDPSTPLRMHCTHFPSVFTSVYADKRYIIITPLNGLRGDLLGDDHHAFNNCTVIQDDCIPISLFDSLLL